MSDGYAPFTGSYIRKNTRPWNWHRHRLFSVPCAAVPVDVARFQDLGIAGPFTVLSMEDCAELRAHLASRRPPSEWRKGGAITNPALYRLAVLPAIVDRLVPLLGPNIVLWGVDVLVRLPGAIHHWHTDMESADAEGECVSVWLGLAGTDVASGLRFVARSHKVGQSVQDVARGRGRPLSNCEDREVLEWARQSVPAAAIVRPPVAHDGSAVIFDGSVWHASTNDTAVARSAVLLQYARASRLIRIPKLETRSGPFAFDGPAPCLVVCGEGAGPNRLVAAPR
jgi:hypothetical protein